jgi:hypothetical protein
MRRTGCSTRASRTTFAPSLDSQSRAKAGRRSCVRLLIQDCTFLFADYNICAVSATWPESVRRLASTFQRDPVRVTVGSDDLTANSRVEQGPSYTLIIYTCSYSCQSELEVFEDPRSKEYAKLLLFYSTANEVLNLLPAAVSSITSARSSTPKPPLRARPRTRASSSSSSTKRKPRASSSSCAARATPCRASMATCRSRPGSRRCTRSRRATATRSSRRTSPRAGSTSPTWRS